MPRSRFAGARSPRSGAGAFLSTAVPCLLAAGLCPVRARADYVCQALDVPGSTWTQVWQLNNAGQVAASSDLGGFVYSGGAWLPLPPPPPGSGYGPADVNPVGGINDAGTIAGVAVGPGAVLGQGFILSGGAYSFFSYLPGTYSFTAARAISNAGIVTGQATDANGNNVGFVYNPSSAPGYAPGFTEVVPALNGTPASFTLPGGMNDLGQFVGTTRIGTGHYGFLYDPSWQSHGYGQLITLFTVGGMATRARGINDKGHVTGFALDATGHWVGYLLTKQGYQLITCPQIAGRTDVVAEFINDSDVVSGQWIDAGGNLHGFIAYPDAVLPVASANGAFVFDAAVSPATPVFLDPAVAVGYQYAVGAGNPLFTSVTLPIGIGDNLFTVIVQGRAFELPAGQELDFTRNGFTGGVPAFEVLGIETGANLDPANPTAFVTEVTFGGAGRFTGTMRPMSTGDVIADLLGAVTKQPRGRGLAQEVREVQAAFAAGDVREACEELAGFIREVNARAGEGIPRPLAAALVAEAQAIQHALGCTPKACDQDEDGERKD